MKRFLVFVSNSHAHAGGLSDVREDHDTAEEAAARAEVFWRADGWDTIYFWDRIDDVRYDRNRVAGEWLPDKRSPAVVEFVRHDGRHTIVRNVSGRKIERGELVTLKPQEGEGPKTVDRPERCSAHLCNEDAVPGRGFCQTHGNYRT